MDTFYSNGKLLLTGEYVVLDGAKTLGLSTQYGQELFIQKINEPKLIWESYDNQNSLWLQVEFDLPQLRIISETFDSNIEGGNDSLAIKLQEVLLEAKRLNSDFLNSDKGFYAKSKLGFPRDWGLGSSSTLINNVAKWAGVNAFELQFNTFGGSGYDIACAQNDSPIIYHLKDQKPEVHLVEFNPSFKDQLYFVHLNKKQDSREAIAAYNNFNGNIDTFVDEISSITDQMIDSSSLPDFEILMAVHEQLISKVIHQEPIQKQLFSDYFGQTKSLGAWGGDFILATGNENTPNYFKNKGYTTVIPYQEMILTTSS